MIPCAGFTRSGGMVVCIGGGTILGLVGLVRGCGGG